MKIKWLFGTGLLAFIVFFSAIYFGMKYNWVHSANQQSVSNTQSKLKPQPNHLTDKRASTQLSNRSSIKNHTTSPQPQLIDEVERDQFDEVVAQCRKASESIGVPVSKLDQSIAECVNRKNAAANYQSELSHGALSAREQCTAAISQNELLSNEEIKILIDDCSASMNIE